MGWTRFMDVHSGGDLKLPPYTHIYIESDSRAKGVSIFREKFGRHPEHITCPCCGEDYSISFGEDLAQLTGFERGCAYARRGDEGRYIGRNTGGEPLPAANGWSIEHVPFGTPYLMLDEYIARPDVLIVPREVGS